MDRLRHEVGVALGVACAAAPPPPVEVLLPRLRQHDDGQLLAEDLDTLRQDELTAARVQNYRQAALLHDTYQALRPQRRLTLAECAPTDVEAQHAFFLEHGFLLIHNIIQPEQVARAQAAWNVAQERAEAAWEANKVALGTALDASQQLYYDLPNLLEEDDVFIDMIDSPALVPVMSRITGSERALDPDSTVAAAGYTGCMRVGGMGGRVVPSESGENFFVYHC